MKPLDKLTDRSPVCVMPPADTLAATFQQWHEPSCQPVPERCACGRNYRTWDPSWYLSIWQRQRVAYQQCSSSPLPPKTNSVSRLCFEEITDKKASSLKD